MYLWDELGILHKPHKQINGSPLPIIGISVDVNELSLALPIDAKEALISKLQWWKKRIGGRPRPELGSRIKPALHNFSMFSGKIRMADNIGLQIAWMLKSPKNAIVAEKT